MGRSNSALCDCRTQKAKAELLVALLDGCLLAVWAQNSIAKWARDEIRLDP